MHSFLRSRLPSPPAIACAAVPRPRSSPPSSRLPAAGLQRSGLHNAKEVSYIRQMSRPTIRMVGTKEKL